MSLHREHSLARTRIHDTILHPMNTIIYARSSLDCALSAEDQAASLVDYRHIIHSLRCKPMALLHLVYRDALFPRPAYRAAWERLLDACDARVACRTMVELLALAHERGCEADLAAALSQQLLEDGMPDLAILRARFAPSIACLPVVAVNLPSIASYDVLLPAMAATAGAATP